MSSYFPKDFKQLLHPYAFILKEGLEIQEDLLDYSLVMLHINCREVIKTPSKKAPSRKAKPANPKPQAALTDGYAKIDKLRRDI